MLSELPKALPVTQKEAERLALDHYALEATSRKLSGEYDNNYALATEDGRSFVLKVMHPSREPAFVKMQTSALRHLAERVSHIPLQTVIPTSSGELFTRVRCESGEWRLIWLLSYIRGETLSEIPVPRSQEMLNILGRVLAEIDSALLTFSDPATQRDLKWDLSRALWALEYLQYVSDSSRRCLAEHFLRRFEREVAPRFPRIRRSVIYGDANDDNVLLNLDASNALPLVSLIDFGDMHIGLTVGEPAIAAAYAILGEKDPLHIASVILAGYHAIFPLNRDELAAFFTLIAARLTVSVVNSAHRKLLVPDDPYVTVSEEASWAALRHLSNISSDEALAYFLIALKDDVPLESGAMASGSKVAARSLLSFEESLSARKRLLGANLSLTYEKPLKIVRGYMQHLFDRQGREYLDVYNNVPLVGHSHPHVVRAIIRQATLLNTNTRYLHDNILEYADRLSHLLPEPLTVSYFVNSGSEANELALRLARTHTRSEDVIVLEHAYHGNTSALIDMSPYKFNGPGGHGKREWVHVAPIPDDYRGLYRRGESDIGRKYASHIGEILRDIESQGRHVAAFFAESLPSVAGQIVLPPGYLGEVYKRVRTSGGVCVADEVQVGFGRLGCHFWGFESQGVVPDIVVLGKPIGNGFPLAAVVTTREIANSFNNGMEFFSTFGGNPVSCAAGLAVLDVLESEHLQENALQVGSRWARELRLLQRKHSIVGDVRGSGLFLGVDLVNDPLTRAPATKQASYIVNRLCERGVLVGTDGPHDNVLKLRPPLLFSDTDADCFTSTLASVLEDAPAQPT